MLNVRWPNWMSVTSPTDTLFSWAQRKEQIGRVCQTVQRVDYVQSALISLSFLIGILVSLQNTQPTTDLPAMCLCQKIPPNLLQSQWGELFYFEVPQNKIKKSIFLYEKHKCIMLFLKVAEKARFCFPAKPFSCIIKSLWRLRAQQKTSTWSNAPCLRPQPCIVHCIISSCCMKDR